MLDLIKNGNSALAVPADADEGQIIPEYFASRLFRLPIARANLAAALLAGLALRLFFVIRFSFFTGDTKFYDALARNWLYHGVYGLFVAGQLTPTDMRAPGYPAFLAAVYALFGPNHRAVLIAQVIVGLLTCLGIAAIAARLAPTASRKKAATAALWIAALCPFTANYASILVTEELAMLFTTFALLIFVSLLEHPFIASPNSASPRSTFSFAGWAAIGGILVGLGTLVRPETPLVLAAAGLIFTIRLRRRIDWPKLTLTISWMAVGLLLPLLPWASRNARVLGRIQFLAPHYAETEGDFIPYGFFNWSKTWMTRPDENYLVPWKLGNAPIPIESLPASAFDSMAERNRVATLLTAYNADLKMSPLLDHEFELLARERTARHPLRTYLVIPLERVGAMWFTPPVRALRYSGALWPPGERWRENPWDFGITAGFGLLNLVYFGLAVAGAWHCRARSAMAMLIAFVLIRTALLTQQTSIEPRYVILCFPAFLAIAAQAWTIARPSLATSAARSGWAAGQATAD
ncbi:MAG TPA: glycosyltransferase family 39 protein [Verrucomicrobiae bacterium]|nr:glycosyltransferase family 39 protein [Verrucomicrobiae bacterium]